MDVPDPQPPPDPLPPAAPPDAPAAVPRPAFNLDRSDVIAIIALVISLLGTLLAYRETSILNEQQQLAMEQKAAGVWPYMGIERNFNYENDSILTVSLFLDNNGVGPALISSLTLVVGDEAVRPDSVAHALAGAYPDHPVEQISSHVIENSIASPGERTVLFVLVFNTERTPFAVVSEMMAAVEFNCCYCSVYGDCWRYVEDEWAVRAADCVVPAAILRAPAR